MYNKIQKYFGFVDFCLGLSSQTEDPPESTTPTGIDPSRPDWHLRRVDDGSQPLELDFGGSSGRFHPQKPKLPDPPNKTSKKVEIQQQSGASQL